MAISGYDTKLYQDMLVGWKRHEKTSYSQVCSRKQEVLWLNYEPPCCNKEIEELLDTEAILLDIVGETESE